MNNNKIVNFINKSNLIVIYGSAGSGRTLLLGKLANHPLWKGKSLEGLLKPQTPPRQGNVFIFNVEHLLGQITQKELREWELFFASARHTNQKIFLSIDSQRIGDLFDNFKSVVDLIIWTQELQGTSKPEFCKIQVNYGDKIIKERVKITPTDLPT